VQALGRMALHFRSQFDGPVIGVTGSAGKTTTKEFIAAALSPLGPVLKTEGNRNTEYTAPLLWAEMEPGTKAVVVEMSMRGFGQVAHLAEFSQPNIGVITNVGYAHIEMVGSREGIARAKGELLEALPSEGTAVLWSDDPFLGTLSDISPCPVKTFGFAPESDCRVTSYAATGWSSAIVGGVVDGMPWSAEMPAVGRHIAVNAAAAVLCAYLSGVSPIDAGRSLGAAQLPPMRMAVEKLNGATILLDTYNASPPSMVAAIETLAELPCAGRRLAVIGEMKELGDFTEEGHRMVGRALANYKMDAVVLLGEPTRFTAEAAIKAGLPDASVIKASCLEDVTEFLRNVEAEDTVLIKGSRALELEKALLPLRGVTA
jgi:UDP-N-acetylmuramoyl-tripeptide--D-alanyl-D-alanine ligase